MLFECTALRRYRLLLRHRCMGEVFLFRIAGIDNLLLSIKVWRIAMTIIGAPRRQTKKIFMLSSLCFSAHRQRMFNVLFIKVPKPVTFCLNKK